MISNYRHYIGCFAAVLLCMLISPSFAEESHEIDGTQLFEEEVRAACEASDVSLQGDFTAALSARGVTTPEVRVKSVGETETFWARNVVTREFERIDAVLEAIGEHCYVYVEKNAGVPTETVSKIARCFDDEIYPVDTKYFGSEPKPGIDGDRRITLFMLDIRDDYNGSNGFVGGYFYGIDCLPAGNVPEGCKSNQREMLYLDIYPAKPDSEKFLGTIAHEFQHMIHFNHDRGEYAWVNEACSQLAPYLCGYAHPNQLQVFQKTPDISLTAWSPESVVANYGQVYLWLYYIYYRLLIENSYGNQVKFLRNLVASRERGMTGMIAALESIQRTVGRTFDNFCIASYINDPKLGKGRRYYLGSSLEGFKLPVSDYISAFPTQLSGDVKLWSSDAIEVDLSRAKSEIEVIFEGEMRRFDCNGLNSYSIALILSDSDEKLPSHIEFLKTKKDTGSDSVVDGYLSTPVDPAYDKALIVVVSKGPEISDEKKYQNQNTMKYKLRVRTFGQNRAEQL